MMCRGSLSPVLVKPARENAERFRIDQREVTVEHHEDAVDVDMAERKGDLEKVFDVLAEHELPQHAGGGLVRPVAKRYDDGVFADESHPTTFEKSWWLDGAQNRHTESFERAPEHQLVAPSTFEIR